MSSYIVIYLPNTPSVKVILNKSPMNIGRVSTNEIKIPVAYISERHGCFEFEVQEQVWYYTDLGSTNGTFINGSRIQKYKLTDGNILTIGRDKNIIRLEFHTTVQKKHKEIPTENNGTEEKNTSDQHSEIYYLIGRNPSSDIYIPKPTVSWRHAFFEKSPYGAKITDLNSTNGTFVNGRRVTHSHLLSLGDVVHIGPAKLTYKQEGLIYQPVMGLSLVAKNLTLIVGKGKRKKQILNNISLSIQEGEFVALVGPSGAGKSSLLKALIGLHKMQGQVLVDERDLHQSLDFYRMDIGYVPQKDIIHQELNVYPALWYSAQLRLPVDNPNHGEDEINKYIDRVLSQLSLSQQKEQQISSLSGGQIKRVSIAVELLADPKLFFLDEPTSGLDPGLDKKMMESLRQLADEGRTVVLVTHTTANIEKCDLMCFLAQGHLVYFGPPKDAFKFFEIDSNDYADLYTKVDSPIYKEAKEKAQYWEKQFVQHSSQYQRYIRERLSKLSKSNTVTPFQTNHFSPRINPWQQFVILTRRYFDLVFRDKVLRTVLISIMPAIGFLLLLISEPNWLIGNTSEEIEAHLSAELSTDGSLANYAVVGNTQQLLFMMSLAVVLLGLFAAAYEINKEQHIYHRERMVNLRIFPYLASKVIVLGSFILLQCGLLLLVVSVKVKFPKGGVLIPAPIEFYITLVLGAIAATLLGLLISSIISNRNSIIYVVLLVLFVQIIFAGIIFKLPGSQGELLSSLTLTRWTMEGLGSSANIEDLNTQTRTRYKSEPQEKDFSTSIEIPDPDWKPVTVITGTQQIPIEVSPGITRTIAISVPQVTLNEMITITDVITRPVTIDSRIQDILNPREFQIDYSRTPDHLWKTWLFLIGLSLLFNGSTLFVLKIRDIQ